MLKQLKTSTRQRGSKRTKNKRSQYESNTNQYNASTNQYSTILLLVFKGWFLWLPIEQVNGSTGYAKHTHTIVVDQLPPVPPVPPPGSGGLWGLGHGSSPRAASLPKGTREAELPNFFGQDFIRDPLVDMISRPAEGNHEVFLRCGVAPRVIGDLEIQPNPRR